MNEILNDILKDYFNHHNLFKSWDLIKHSETIYVGCASDIYTRYPFQCKEIENALKLLFELLGLSYE